jgi:hypothetical protein
MMEEEFGPSETKEEPTSSVRVGAIDIDHSQNFWLHQPEEDDGDTLD